MKRNIVKQSPFALLLLLALILACGSGLEKFQGSAIARTWVYTSPLVVGLWAVCTLLALRQLHKAWRRLHWGSRMLHMAFPIILTGALVSHLSAVGGRMELTVGTKPIDGFFLQDGKVEHLPFAVILDRCEMPRHTKSGMPTDYISHLRIVTTQGDTLTAKTSMNRVLRYEGWRLYQTEMNSYTSVLTVRKDVWGIGITYCGYALLFVAAILSLLHRNSAFRQLLRHPVWKKSHMLGLLCFFFPLTSQAANVTAERIYEHMLLPEVVGGCCIAIGLLGYLEVLRHLMTAHRLTARSRRLQNLVVVLAALWMVTILILRAHIGGYAPFTNGCEALLTMGVAVAGCALLLARRFPPVLPFGLLLCGFTVFASTIGDGHEHIDTIRPILKSPLLSWHVVIIMLAYALFTIMAFNGATAWMVTWCMPRREKTRKEETTHRISLINRLLLYPALLLLATGIFIGAIWANLSWGTYWSWDPKETWALITLLVYAIPAHSNSLPFFTRPSVVNAYCVVAYLTVLMTYFGVNFLLGGMHSYV